jgi:hypothetical protein
MRHDLSHAQTEADFNAALWGPEPPAGITAPERSEVAQRFKVYRNNVQHSLTRALAARFPVIEQLVGAEFFIAMARVFVAAAPPSDPVMLRWGNSFASFLDEFPPVTHLPFLGDVARLEYARGRACHAADADPVAPDVLAAADLESLRLVLHPSVTLFTSSWPAVQIWQAHQAGATRAPLAPGPDHALIARQPDFTVIVERIEPDTFAVLSALYGGETLGLAAEKADPTPALTLLLRHGLIIDIGAPR